MIPERWSRTVQILLEKYQVSPWSNRLRIIELFDSQVNAGLQIIFGKRMIKNALEKGEIHDSTYGSVPRRTAQDAVMEKVLSMDTMRTKQITGAIFDCDAKGCYDRIIAALQSISSRRLGVPRTTAIYFSRFWQMCKHHIRTRHGTSKEYYQSSIYEMLYGIGQGNGAGPAFWLSNLIVMFMVLDTLNSGMQFRSPNKSRKYKSTGMGYVDDVTLGCTTTNETSNEEIKLIIPIEEENTVKTITSMGQNWEKMLNTNGGLLELKKCYWLIISWKWKEGVAHLKEVKELDATMTIRQTEGDKEITIPRKSVIEAPKILGCHVAANGNWEREAGR